MRISKDEESKICLQVKMNKWQLWKKETFSTVAGGKKFLFQTDYAFVRPDGIINELRVINPYGCLPFRNIYEADSGFWLWDLAGEPVEFLKQFDGWKKARTTMTDEQLEKGWLI